MLPLELIALYELVFVVFPQEFHERLKLTEVKAEAKFGGK